MVTMDPVGCTCKWKQTHTHRLTHLYDLSVEN